MKKILPTLALALLLLGSCGQKQRELRVAGLAIDSVAVDTVVALGEGRDAPRCELHLHLQYVKDTAAQAINAELLRDGLIMLEYYPFGEPLSVAEQVEDFVSRYIAGYQAEYGPLYRADTGHATAYNSVYSLHTHFEERADGVLTSIARLYTYGGGAHGISQTLVRNVDVAQRSIITLADLFTEGYEPQLCELITERLCRQQKVDNLAALQEQGIFADGQVYASENFLMDDDKLTFIYCEDEIAPHAVGEIRVDLKRKDLKKLWK